MNCAQYAYRNKQDFPGAENIAGSCYLKMHQMARVAPRSTRPFILISSIK